MRVNPRSALPTHTQPVESDKKKDRHFRQDHLRAPEQKIFYRDLRRRTYREFRERIGRLASGLGPIGVDRGDDVAILENGGQVGAVSALVSRFARNFSGSP
jgi:acyl-CoA synthetase (AMP-forming)/AMP-acid ligase II